MASTLSRFRTRWPTLSAEGGCGGASTISQQVSKNLFLWQGRSFVRKGLEAYFTVLIELLWSKGRILEVYLNVGRIWRRGLRDSGRE